MLYDTDNHSDGFEMLSCRLQRCSLHILRLFHPIRPFSTSPRVLEKPLPQRRSISENEITESFLKGSGPGGQKINKTSSAVQLKHIPTGIVVKSQETRSREQNRKTARRILAEKLEEIEKGDESRTAIKTQRARVKKASADKKSKRKYKKLAEEKAVAGDGASPGSENPEPRSESNDSTENESSEKP